MVTTTSTSPATGKATSAASIAKTLGVGSGVDLSALVTSLVDAQFAIKTDQLTARSDKLEAQISGLSKLKSGITGFSTALAQLAKGGTLATQVASADTSVVRATTTGGAVLAGYSGSLEVRQLAGAQSATTAQEPGIKRTDAVGTGRITVTFGTGDPAGDAFAPSGSSFFVDIGAGDATLDGIAKKINAAGRGMTASVVTMANNEAKLVIKGPTGEARAFRIETAPAAGSPGGAGLGILNTGPGGRTKIVGGAQDAKLVLDGVEVTRASNSVTDLVAGVRFDLVAAKTGVPVSIGSTPATASLTQAVEDVVATYNEFLSVMNTETAIGASLYGDSDATMLKRNMARLTLTPLVPPGAPGSPRTLAEIGVGTNRDGSLKVDATRLAAALDAYPGVVEAMFQASTASATGTSGGGLPAALATITAAAVSTRSGAGEFGLNAATTRYTKAQTALDIEQEKADAQADLMRERLTKQFAAMDTRVAAYKATQAFLTQQVDMWTKSDN